MKNLDRMFLGVLLVAVLVLYVLHFKGNGCCKEEVLVANTEKEGEKVLPIAYISADSLLLNYKYAVELNDVLMKKQEKAQSTLAQKGKSLEKEMADFQRKVENNAFLSRERAEAEQTRLLKAQQDLQELSNKYATDLAREQQEMNKKLSEKIIAFIHEYNKDKKYQFIFSNTMNDNILYAEKGTDITEDLLLHLNEAYTAEKGK